MDTLHYLFLAGTTSVSPPPTLSGVDQALMRDTLTVNVDAKGEIAGIHWLASINKGSQWRPLTEAEGVASCGSKSAYQELVNKRWADALRRTLKQRLDTITDLDVLRRVVQML